MHFWEFWRMGDIFQWLVRQTNLGLLPCLLDSGFLSLFLGMSAPKMALTLSGFASIPLCDTMNPKNLPEETPKTNFVGFNFILYLWSILKVFLFRLQLCFSPACRLYRLPHFAYLVREHSVDQPLVCGSSIFLDRRAWPCNNITPS